MKTVIGLTLTTLLLAGCGGSAGKAGTDPLEGTAWALERMADAPVPAGVTVTARFHEGRVGGSAGCNQYFASYAVVGDSLRIGPAGATKMMCPDPAMAVEGLFLAALGDVAGFRLAEGRLHLVRPDGETLIFTGMPFAAAVE